MSIPARISQDVLDRKTVVVGFLKAQLSSGVIQAFEDAMALGREQFDAYTVQIDHNVRPDASIQDLMSLSRTTFSSPDNMYHPYFFVVLDNRTAEDGSVLLVHDREPDGEKREGDPPEEIRITPASIANFVANINIGHTTIEETICNDLPEDEEETWVYDASFDNGITRHDVRIPLSKFQRADGPSGLTRLTLEDVAQQAPVLPSCKVELCWFGQPPEDVLIQCLEENGSKSVTFSA